MGAPGYVYRLRLEIHVERFPRAGDLLQKGDVIEVERQKWEVTEIRPAYPMVDPPHFEIVARRIEEEEPPPTLITRP